MKYKPRPTGDRVVIDVIPPVKKIGEIELPESAQHPTLRGYVLAVGPGKYTSAGHLVPVDLKVGDLVVYSKFGGNEIKIGGREYLVIDAEHIRCVLEPDGEDDETDDFETEALKGVSEDDLAGIADALDPLAIAA